MIASPDVVSRFPNTNTRCRHCRPNSLKLRPKLIFPAREGWWYGRRQRKSCNLCDNIIYTHFGFLHKFITINNNKRSWMERIKKHLQQLICRGFYSKYMNRINLVLMKRWKVFLFDFFTMKIRVKVKVIFIVPIFQNVSLENFVSSEIYHN